jgi:hypothetical protein
MGCGLKRILQLKEAIQYQSVKIFDDIKDITLECDYSWSVDGVCWTSWTNYNTYELVCSNIESDFYLRILLKGGFHSILLNNFKTDCYSICLDTGNVFLNDFCEQGNLFQPYNNLDCALLLQQQLSDSIVCMFGIPIYYIKVNPNKTSVDYTFKEYSLNQVEDIKQLKLMIPDGTMPSSNPKLTEFDFEWEIDWETELGKNSFAKAFGDNAFPKRGDYVYIPMMKRMWMVNSAYDEKNEGLMWRSTTWKLTLVKYSENTNVDTNIFEGIIDNWTSNTYENIFGGLELNEQEREVGTTPFTNKEFTPTNLVNIFMEDAVRKQYTKYDALVLDKQYNQKSIVVGRNIYKFKKENGCITYQKQICGDSGTIMFILETPGTLKNILERNIVNFGPIISKLCYNPDNQLFKILFDDLEQTLEPFKSYMVFLKWNRINFTKELCVYEYIHDKDVPVYKLKPFLYEFDFNNPICELVGMYNNDFCLETGKDCYITGYPVSLTNIKYYNTYLDNENSIKESVKYSTQHENCVINDLARPIEEGHGYIVK